MKNLSILATAVVAASLLVSANVANAQVGGYDFFAEAKEMELAIANTKARATAVATKNAGGATQTK